MKRAVCCTRKTGSLQMDRMLTCNRLLFSSRMRDRESQKEYWHTLLLVLYRSSCALCSNRKCHSNNGTDKNTTKITKDCYKSDGLGMRKYGHSRCLQRGSIIIQNSSQKQRQYPTHVMIRSRDGGKGWSGRCIRPVSGNMWVMKESSGNTER